MNRRFILGAFLVCALALLINFHNVFAHTAITTGNYTIEVGWTDEPPVVGQRNAIVVNVSDSTDATVEIDISMLTVNVVYGDQTKTLTLQPLSEDSKNQYIAPILPAVAGTYTVKLGGMVGTTTVDNSVDVEEVVGADELSFPVLSAEKTSRAFSLGMSDWLAIAAIFIGFAGLVMGFLAFQKTR